MEMTIYEAASSNQVQFVQEALAGAYGEIPAQDLELALLRSAAKGHMECMNLLLGTSVDIMAKDGMENTALIVAAEQGHTDAVDLLIGKGCSVNYQNSYGYTALMKACENGHLKIAEMLIKNGADESFHSNVHAPAANGHCPHSMLQSPDARPRKDMPHGYTPLMITVLKQAEGYVDMIKLLLRAHVNVNDRDLEECTVLHHAAKRCRADVLEILLQADADVNAQDVWGTTALMSASGYNMVDNVKVLLKYGANVSVVCKAKRTALSVAVRTSSEEIIDSLLAAGADPDHTDAHSKTPIFIAMGHKNYTAVKCLIRYGCDLTISCRDMISLQRMPLLKYAIWLKDVQLIDMIYRAGACSNQSLYLCSQDKSLPENCADRPEVLELLHRLASMPRNLKQLCRNVIRENMAAPLPQSIASTSLPKPIQDFILYSDISIREDVDSS